METEPGEREAEAQVQEQGPLAWGDIWALGLFGPRATGVLKLDCALPFWPMVGSVLFCSGNTYTLWSARHCLGFEL